MEPTPKGWTDRLVGICTSVLVGAMALWGAFYIVMSIWPFLAIVAFVVVVVGVIYARFRRW